MSGYSLETAPSELQKFILELVEEIVSSFSDRIVSIILHGSLAMGSFYLPKSDIDILIVSNSLDEVERQTFYSLLQKHHDERPFFGGLEVSVILDRDARNPKHPSPFLVHFSETEEKLQELQDGHLPVDPDLIAHLIVARERGISLYGQLPKVAVGEVNWSDYVASVKTDIDWILEGENILSTPFYSILNLCRWIMMHSLEKQIIPSKEEAALWALQNPAIPNKQLIQTALEAYRSITPVKNATERRLAGREWDSNTLLRFRDEMRNSIPNPKSRPGWR